MALSDDIEHICTMIYMNVDGLRASLMNEVGYVDRMQRTINEGGFATEDTMEAMQLKRSVKYLGEMKNALENILKQLVANSLKNVS